MTRARFNIANERAVLVAALSDLDTRRKVSGVVTPTDYVMPVHRELYRALLFCGDGVVDAPKLMLKAGSADVGGREYIDGLLTETPPADLDAHMLELRRAAVRLHAVTPSEKLVASLNDRTVSHEDCERMAVEVLSGLKSANIIQSSGKALAKGYIKDLRARWSGDIGFLSTGYDALDTVLTEGFAPGVFACICGRTRNGKTMFTVDMVRRLLKGNPKPRILVWPLEVGKTRFLDMLVASVTMTDTDLLIKRPGDMTLDDREKVQKAVWRLVGRDDRLVVMENPFYELGGNWTNDAAMDMTERLIAAGGYDIVLADLWDRKLVDHRPQALSAALFREQAMCLKYGFCSIAVHQVRREVEREKDKRPKLMHLKGSGAWEEATGLVLGVHREKAYKPLMRDDLLEVEVLKQKLGDLGDVMEGGFEPQFCRLRDPVIAGAGKDRKPMFPADSGE